MNLALHLLDGAYQNAFDRAIVLTADADLAPAVEMIQNRFPKIQITGLLPNTRSRSAQVMRRACHSVSIFNQGHLARNLFPATIALPGGATLTRPPKYDPPPPPSPTP